MRRVAVGLVVAALASACTSTVGPYVRNVWVDGNLLVVERCAITYSSPMGGSISDGPCITEQVQLPVDAAVSPSPPPSLSPVRPAPRPADSRACEPVLERWRTQQDFVQKTKIYDDMPEACRRRITRAADKPR